MNENLPIEVIIEKAKYEMALSINAVGRTYNLPPSILVMIAQEVIDESKINAYETILHTCDVVPPNPPEDDKATTEPPQQTSKSNSGKKS